MKFLLRYLAFNIWETIITKRQLMAGACLFCLFQAVDVSYAFAKDVDLPAEALLFGQPSVDVLETLPKAQLQSIELEIPEKTIPNNQTSQVPVETLTQVEPQAGGKETLPVLDGPLITEDQVDLQADTVEYDEPNNIVSAVGDVELMQAGRILRADKVSYNLAADKVEAIGNVVVNETTGDVFFADKVELENEMKDGFVNGLRGVMADGSRFSAEEAQKIADVKMILNKADYTPCEPCKSDPSKVLWAITADKVTHHKDEQRIAYEDATFEVLGTPIAYLPYFSHPDGSIERKSGFLTPSFGYESDLGGIYEQQYYWDIAPNRDATIGAMVMTNEAPLLMGEYRHRFKDAALQLSGGATYSSRTDSIGGKDVETDEEERGHLFANGLWNINDKWRSGVDLALVSDEQYFRQYNITNEDVLENKIYAERFSGRDYTLAQLIKFKDIRVSDRQVDQPSVLPQIYSRFLGNPNETLGGRWSLEGSALGLQREGNDQDLAHVTLKTGWEKRHISNLGLINKLNLGLRGDAYQANDLDIARSNNNLSSDASELRGFAFANYEASMPFEKNYEKAQAVIEPIASLTAGTDVDETDDIPNEDSQDVFLAATNIFNPNRFPGDDRIEDNVHATYGVRTGLYGDNGYRGEVFLGQSYRFDKSDNPFPEGSGLDERESDFVGSVTANIGEKLNLSYNGQFGNDNLASKRHELDATGKLGPVELNTRYFYANALQGTDFNESREQVRVAGRYHFNDQWSAISAVQYDLAEETEGLRKFSYGLDYQGQCVTFLVQGRRTLTSDSSGDSGTEIMMRLGLKNLGEFETSGFSLGSSDDD